MIKKFFVTSEEKTISNTFAGVAFVVSSLAIYSILKPTTIYMYIITFVAALAFCGAAYGVVAEAIRKKSLK